MILNVYSVFDSKLASFGRPWYELTDASAIRVFSDAVNDTQNPNNQWNRHPEDFSLYRLGQFDDENGKIDSALPVSLVTASVIFNVLNPVLGGAYDKNGQKLMPIDA